MRSGYYGDAPSPSLSMWAAQLLSWLVIIFLTKVGEHRRTQLGALAGGPAAVALWGRGRDRVSNNTLPSPTPSLFLFTHAQLAIALLILAAWAPLNATALALFSVFHHHRKVSEPACARAWLAEMRGSVFVADDVRSVSAGGGVAHEDGSIPRLPVRRPSTHAHTHTGGAGAGDDRGPHGAQRRAILGAQTDACLSRSLIPTLALAGRPLIISPPFHTTHTPQIQDNFLADIQLQHGERLPFAKMDVRRWFWLVAACDECLPLFSLWFMELRGSKWG